MSGAPRHLCELQGKWRFTYGDGSPHEATWRRERHCTAIVSFGSSCAEARKLVASLYRACEIIGDNQIDKKKGDVIESKDKLIGTPSFGDDPLNM